MTHEIVVSSTDVQITSVPVHLHRTTDTFLLTTSWVTVQRQNSFLSIIDQVGITTLYFGPMKSEGQVRE